MRPGRVLPHARPQAGATPTFRHHLCLLLLALAFLCGVPAARAQTGLPVPDYSFEQVQVGAGDYQYRTTGSPWAFAGSSGLSANGSGFTQANPNAPDGAQIAFVQATGSLSQSVSGFQAGATYTLTVSAAQRVAAPGYYNNASQTVGVQVDGQSVGSFTPAGTAYADYSVTFTTAAGSHTLAFVGLNPQGGDNTALLDNVRITGVTTGPTGLTATAGSSSVALAWNPVSGASTYNVYRGTFPGGEGSAPYKSGVSGASGASYTDTAVTAGRTYSYQVTAVVSGGEGGRSNEASAMVPNAAPAGSVSVLSLTDLFLSPPTVTALIQWPAQPHQTNTYTVTRTPGGGTSTANTYWYDASLQSGTTYTYHCSDRWTDPPYYDSNLKQWVSPSGTTDLGTVSVTPVQVAVADNQSVDARYDPRYATWTFLDHNFGTTTYRGGLFAGYNADNAQVGHAYLKFALPAVPSGKTLWPVGSVNAYFTRCYAAGTATVACGTVSSAWAGATLTWDTAPAFSPAGATAAQQAAVTYDGTPASAAWAHWEMGGDIVSALTGGTGAYAAALGGLNEPPVGTSGPSGGGASGWAYFDKREAPDNHPALILYAYSN